MYAENALDTGSDNYDAAKSRYCLIIFAKILYHLCLTMI